MRITILSILTIAFFSSAFLFEHFHRNDNALEEHAIKIQKGLHQMESEVDMLVESYKTAVQQDLGISFLQNQELSEKRYGVFLYQADSLLFWNNSKVITVPDSAGGIRHLNNGYYYVKKIDLNNQLILLAAFPLKYDYLVDADYQKNYYFLENDFISDEDSGNFIDLKVNGKGAPIYSSDGKKCCDISFYKENRLSHANQYRLLVLFVLAFFCLAMLVNSLAFQIKQGPSPKLGVLFFGLSILGIKLLTVSINLNQRLGDVAFFLSSLEPVSFDSTGPGATMINILLFLWVIIYYYKHIESNSMEKTSFRARIAAAIGLYIAIISGLLMTVQTHKIIITSPDLTFDFNNFFYIDVTTTMSISSILMIWFALFLFNFKLTKNILAFGLTMTQRVTIFVSILLLLFIVLQYQNIFEQSPLGIIAMGFVYIMLLDWFADEKHSSIFSWYIIWITFFGLSSTLLFYSYHRSADAKNLKEAVEKLASEKDHIVIRDLNDIADYVKKHVTEITDRATLQKTIDLVTKRKGYLLDHYQLLLTDTLKNVLTTDARGLYNDNNLDIIDYDVRLPFMDNGEIKYYRLEAITKKVITQNSYEENLFQTPYLKIKDFSKISYSIFKDKKFVKGYGNDYPTVYPMPDSSFSLVQNTIGNKDYSQYVREIDANRAIVGKISYTGYHRMIFILTYLLVFLLGISFFIITINTYTNFIDNVFVLSLKGSLQTKVQQVIVVLLVFSCIFIGAISIIYFTKILDNNNVNYLNEKLTSIQSNIQNDLRGNNINTNLLDSVIAPISKTHQIDINIYDLSGKMLNRGQRNIVRKGIISDMMNANAFKALKKEDAISFVVREKIGNFNYQAAYGKITQQNKTIAYFGLPCYKKEWERNNELSDTISNLLVFYVLLIFVVVIFSYLVARLLLKPIRDIGAKLKLVQLGQTSLDVQWRGADALGDLIREFNVMLSNLRTQAQTGVQNARDEAWQQMAKQIAHDIRNTLTPMKLSIQFLEHSSSSPDVNPTIGERIRRISATLVEQINHFNQIANNFGDFAKARTEPSAIESADLNDFLALNCELFKNNLESKTAVNVFLPKDTFFVRIDRAQMARVVTNLITNAQQAIPENREGRIDVYLFEQDDKAVIRISDNGSGIPAEQIEQIFQPNFTTKNSGTGLGLAICRKLVQDVEGHIYCTSVLHQGSDFYVELPIEYKIPYEENEDTETNEA